VSNLKDDIKLRTRYGVRMRNQAALIFCLTPLLLTVLLASMNAQTETNWQKTYGGSGKDFGWSVQQTLDGGYVIVGYTNSFGAGGYDVYLVKTDAYGNQLWQRTYGGTGNDFGWSVQQTSDGGYIIVGYTRPFITDDYDVYLVKTDASGNQLWQMTYGGTGNDLGWSVKQTSDGGYIIAGSTGSFGAGSSDVYLVKTDSSGKLLWQKTYGGVNSDGGYSVQQTSDGGYVIVGDTWSFGAGGDDVYLVKTDASGDQLWQMTYGGTGDDFGYSIQQTSDGGYVIAGWTNLFGAGGYDVYLVKTDSSGKLLWQRTYGGTGNDYGRYVQQTSDGGYVIAGYTNSFGAGGDDVYLIKTDASGNQLWQMTYGGRGDDFGYSVQQTSDGGYVIAGSTSSFGIGYEDIYLIKTDVSGNTSVQVGSNGTGLQTTALAGGLQTPFLLYGALCGLIVLILVVILLGNKYRIKFTRKDKN